MIDCVWCRQRHPRSLLFNSLSKIDHENNSGIALGLFEPRLTESWGRSITENHFVD